MAKTSSAYQGLPFTQGELIVAMRSTYDELLDLFYTESFQKVWQHIKSLPGMARYAFIKGVLLNPHKLREEWNVEVPEDIFIQRSSFGDRRPTLFCFKKYLPEKFHCVWENVNLTFDEIYEDSSVSRDPKIAWRDPIIPEIQSVLIGAGLPLEDVPPEFRQPIVIS